MEYLVMLWSQDYFITLGFTTVYMFTITMFYIYTCFSKPHVYHAKQFFLQTHCVTTEKVPAKYRSLKMAEASLGKWSIFNECGGIASTRHWISVHRGKKSAWKRFRILVQSREALAKLYDALEGPV